MGHGRWSDRDWDSYATKNTRGKSTREIFNNASLKDDLNPRKIQFRESRDSKDNPNSTPIILALDVTGSMGMIAAELARDGLGSLIEKILARKPVSDPHIMIMGVGDANCDSAPLQVSQFEADIRIAKQLKELYLEGGGGGNHFESYNLPWYFAARKTEIDSVSRGKKGIIFTFGDEQAPPSLTKEQIKHYLGDTIPKDLSSAELLAEVSKKYDVFHVVIEQGNYASRDPKRVYDSWKQVLPESRIIPVKDYKVLPEILVSVMEVYGGKKPQEVINSWQDEKVAKVVKEAIAKVDAAGASAPKKAPAPAAKPKVVFTK